MARITPISIPSGVQVSISEQHISVKGSKGAMEHHVHPLVEVSQQDNELVFKPRAEQMGAIAQTGTARAVVRNMLTGVSEGFQKKLELVGVGYRAQAQGKVLNLTLGFSHPVAYPVPEGVTIETPSQTEVLIKGIDKQKVGQVAAEIRAYRPPEPYKGKGVKYSDEHIIRKEAKKK
ncbi:MAG: 50S ribosomal protein L6 [Gammaproteobacteria bacterium]|nr:50S ribosomal protein L6 [Gammaproteobacteria bacterium]MDH5651202.1 50S ribosomal protein L6 [Gammaproteobacteria bacterium]